MTLPVVLLLLLTALAWLLLVGILHPPTVLAIALATSIAGQSLLAGGTTFLPRASLGLVVIAVLLIGHRSRDEWATSSTRTDVGLLSALLVMLAVSLLATTSISTTVSALVGAGAVFFCGAVLGRRLGTEEVFDQLFRASLGFLVVSIAAAPLSSSFEGGRMRGVLENANMLGAVAALTAASTPRRFKWPVTVVAAIVIWFSGSRASAIALVLIVFVRLEWRPGTRLGAVVATPCVAAAALLGLWAYDNNVPSEETVLVLETDASIAAEATGDQATLLRTRDNRTAQWQQGIDDTVDNLPLGSGFGTAAFEYSNSVLFLSVETGLIAIPVVALIILIIGLAMQNHDRRVAAVALGFAGHSMFEGWMFAFGSALAVTFWLVVAAGLASSAEQRPLVSRQRKTPAFDASVQDQLAHQSSVVRPGYFESRGTQDGELG